MFNSKRLAYKHKIAILYILAFFMDMIGISIANIAFPAIGRDLHADAGLLGWIMMAYTLGLTLSMLLSSWLSDRWGTKNIFILSLFLFTVGSFFCSLSNSMSFLIVSRFFQGFGGGLIIPVGQTLLYQEFPRSERARISALVNIPGLIAPALASTVGGLLVGYGSWRAVFGVNIPLGFFLVGLSIFWLQEKKQVAHNKLDFLGSFLMFSSLFSILLGTYFLSEKAFFKNGFFLIFISLAFLICYVIYAKKSKNPILDLKLLRTKNFSTIIYFYIFFTISYYGTYLLFIYFFQNGLGLSAQKSGLYALPLSFGMILGVRLSGYFFNKIGPKPIILSGLLICILSMLSFLLMDKADQFYISFIPLFLMGFGGALPANACQTTVYLEPKESLISKISVFWNLNRQVGICLGAAVTSSLLNILFSSYNLDLSHLEASSPLAIRLFHICFFALTIFAILAILIVQRLDNKQALVLVKDPKPGLQP